MLARAMVIEPSACVVTFEGPEMFSVTALPVLRFVYVLVKEPVVSAIVEPSAALSSFLYALSPGVVTRTPNPP